MKVLYTRNIKKQTGFPANISFLLLFILIIPAILSSSCARSDEFAIGENFVESQTSLKIIDTFRIDLSTVLLDSLATSGTGVALAGSYKDDVFGSVRSSSYFELGYRTFDDIEDLAIFDSAVFILTYSGYSYGDTTSLMSCSIHQLTERISLNDNSYIYNNSTFDFSPSPLGTKLFYPEPNSSDTVVRIPVNNFGEELFRLIVNRDNNITTSEMFLDYLKGFVITSDAGDNSAIIGFLAEANHLFLNIYYHFEEETTSVVHRISIPFGASNKQFNSIQYDFTGTEIDKLKSQSNEVSSAETGDKAYLQALVGLLPKIRFPTLQDILLENNWKILKAELIIEPVKLSYDIFPLPEKLNFYDTDKLNRLNGVLQDENGEAIVSSFTLDELFNEETFYTFDITSYINDELSDSYFDYDHGLLIGLEGATLKSTLVRMAVEGKNPPLKLKLYYLSY